MRIALIVVFAAIALAANVEFVYGMSTGVSMAMIISEIAEALECDQNGERHAR